MAEKNYYIILEVKSTATFDEIKSAYRILAKKYHPDKNIGNKAAEEYFKEVQQAYTVLSNPEKRKKYDLKVSYGSRTQPQQKSNSGGPQYTGNAYQFAQQQAQYKQKQTFAQTKNHSSTEKVTEKENWQILVSVGIAMVLLYFIISYSTEKTTPQLTTSLAKERIEKKNVEATTENTERPIVNYDSPYTSIFGEDIYDIQSKSSIVFFNESQSEAIVCLVEKSAPNKTIRNLYMTSETEIKMNQIPNGEYFLKIYYGNDWSPQKTFLKQEIKGGFMKEYGFIKLNDESDALIMKKEKRGALDSYSAYEIKIDPNNSQYVKRITAESFFKN